MEILHTFSELPYEKLERLGITKTQADNLPLDYKDRLMKGELTPLIVVNLTNEYGQKVEIPVKLQLDNRPDGKVGVNVYPVRNEISKDTRNAFRLSHAEEAELLDGNIIVKSHEKEGIRIERYLQLDPETKSIITRTPEDVRMLERLMTVEKVNDIELGQQQKLQAKEGKPIELNVGGEKVSVGVNLREPQGFKVIKGDLKEWERQKLIKYDIGHPEYIGIVKTDKNKWEYINFVESMKNEHKAEKQHGIKI